LGIQSLQTAFAHLPKSKVYFINLDHLITNAALKEEVNTLHLKSFCSIIRGPPLSERDRPVVVVGGAIGQAFAHWLQETRTEVDAADQTGLIPAPNPVKKDQYEILALPDRDAANCVFINGHLIRRCSQEFPRSGPLFDKFVQTFNSKIENSQKLIVQKPLNCSELAKVDGAITCCSLLF
jgi:hypothetical protein